MAGAAETREGDGNRAKSVTLGMPRGKIRLLRGVSRQLSHRGAARACEGEKTARARRPRSVSRQEVSPSGIRTAAALPACHGSPQGRRESGGIRRPWDASRQNPSPSGRSAAAVLSGCRESTRGRRESGENRRPWGTSRLGASPLGGRAAACLPGCHGSVQGRRKPAGIRHPWGVPRQNPSPSAAYAAKPAPAAPALRAAQNPCNASAPTLRVPLSCSA